MTYTRTVSPRLILESSLSATRATPSFPTSDFTDPAVKFNDGSYEPFNQPAESVISIYGNLFQTRQNLSFTTSSHAFKVGGEVRLNRDTTYFGISPNGEYDFGGGTAYSPVDIPSQSGTHNINAGDPLPDTLSGLLSGSPFVYTVAVAPPYFSSGAAHRRGGHQSQCLRLLRPGHLEDLASPGARLRSALRALYAHHRTREENLGHCFFHHPLRGRSNDSLSTRSRVIASISMAWVRASNWIGWPRTRSISAPAAPSPPSRPIFTRTISLPARLPLSIYPRLTSASQQRPISYGFQITSERVAAVYTPAGQTDFRQRHQSRSSEHRHGSQSLPAGSRRAFARPPDHSADHQLVSTPASAMAICRPGRSGLERHFGNLVADATYIGTAAVKLPRSEFLQRLLWRGSQLCSLHPVRLRQETSSAALARSRSSPAPPTPPTMPCRRRCRELSPHGGPGIQASYTWSKSLDEVSSVVGGFITGGHRRGVQTISAESL